MNHSEQGRDRLSRWGRESEDRRGEGIRYSADFQISLDKSTLYWPNNLLNRSKGDASLREQFKMGLRCLGGYSEDENQNFRNDDSSLTFLNTNFFPTTESKEISVEMDLNCAIEESKQYTINWKKSLHSFFIWVLINKKTKSSELFRFESKIICMKNSLSGILSFHDRYRTNQKKFFAVERNGVTYILNEKEPIPADLNVENWGHKFEQLLTNGENVEKGVNPNTDYRCVLSSQLGPHKIFFSASIDCVNPDLYEGTLTDLSPCVMFKCCYENSNNEEEDYKQRYKRYEWRTGLTLTGTPDILVGYRDSHGIVRRLKLYSEEDLVQDGKNVFNMNTSITFLEKILSFVKERTHSKPGTMFSFVKPERASYVKCEEESTGNDFVPYWFTEEFKCSK